MQLANLLTKLSALLSEASLWESILRHQQVHRDLPCSHWYVTCAEENIFRQEDKKLLDKIRIHILSQLLLCGKPRVTLGKTQKWPASLAEGVGTNLAWSKEVVPRSFEHETRHPHCPANAFSSFRLPRRLSHESIRCACLTGARGQSGCSAEPYSHIALEE